MIKYGIIVQISRTFYAQKEVPEPDEEELEKVHTDTYKQIAAKGCYPRPVGVDYSGLFFLPWNDGIQLIGRRHGERRVSTTGILFTVKY